MNMTKQNDIGIIGLGVMGCNLAINIAQHGFNAAGFDIDEQKVDACSKTSSSGIFATANMDEFIDSLKSPRMIMLLIPAGKPVDSVIQDLLPRLAKGDIVIDGGNSHFSDTDLRMSLLEKHGINFIGMGISGGQHGARYGPSLMPGGPRPAYDQISRILEAVAARASNIPCVTYLGIGSAGHYVKMVHNGIEYGLMRLIAEAYDFMKRTLDFDDVRISKIFGTWSKGELAGYLMEITEVIFKTIDPRTGKYLVDVILDEARQKGTGGWTSENAMQLNVPVPNIDVGVEMRDLSCYKALRQDEARLLAGPPSTYTGDKTAFVDDLARALYMSMLLTYVQGLAPLPASHVYNFGLRLADVARVWRQAVSSAQGSWKIFTNCSPPATISRTSSTNLMSPKWPFSTRISSAPS